MIELATRFLTPRPVPPQQHQPLGLAANFWAAYATETTCWLQVALIMILEILS